MGWLASLPGCILFSAITGGVALLNHRLMAGNPPGFGGKRWRHSVGFFIDVKGGFFEI
jgi:hypothetical protein